MNIYNKNNNFPQIMQNLNCWVAWITKSTNGGKAKKFPINAATYGYAKVNDSSTWCSFEEVKNGNAGFVFTDDNGIVGIDIDNCIDENGNMNEVATKFVSEFSG